MNDYSRWKQKFLTIAAGQTVSLIGSSAVQFSLIWWLASETGSPMMMALSGLVAFLPQIFLGPFAGVWIDRLKRKHVAIAADMFIGLIAVVFAVLLWVGHPPYWSACAVLGIRALGSVFHTPANPVHRAAAGTAGQAGPGQWLEPVHAVRRLYAGTCHRSCHVCRAAASSHPAD